MLLVREGGRERGREGGREGGRREGGREHHGKFSNHVKINLVFHKGAPLTRKEIFCAVDVFCVNCMTNSISVYDS